MDILKTIKQSYFLLIQMIKNVVQFQNIQVIIIYQLLIWNQMKIMKF